MQARSREFAQAAGRLVCRRRSHDASLERGGRSPSRRADRPWRARLRRLRRTPLEVVRLLPLRQRRGAGVPRWFFSELGPTAGPLVPTGDVAWRSCCVPVGGVNLRSPPPPPPPHRPPPDHPPQNLPHFGDPSAERMLDHSPGADGVSTFRGGLPGEPQIGRGRRSADPAAHGAGVALGGEWGGGGAGSRSRTRRRAARPLRRRHQMASGGAAAGLRGFCFLAVLFSALPDAQFFAWGWRVPFLWRGLRRSGVLRFGLVRLRCSRG